jgi:SAM-dependent methyltransferase
MNHVPEDLVSYDFVWSSCSIEHLGSLDAGLRFMLDMTKCLRPGGIAIHTTEYNVSSEHETLMQGNNVIFRRSDLIKMKEVLEFQGHELAALDFQTGTEPADLHVDEPPYAGNPHIRLRLGPFVTTSFGLIVTAHKNQTSWARKLRGWFRRWAA